MKVGYKHKGLMIIVDGIGDRRCPELRGRTPLEAAATPNLDRLAADGITGMLDPLFPGLPVGTHVGTGVLMGLALADAVTLERGPVEAAGIGLDLKADEVVLRCNFATLRQDGADLKILDRRAGRISERTDELASVLRDLPVGDGITASLYPATQHRAVLVLRGSGLSADVTDTDPGSGREARGVRSAQPRNPSDVAAAQRTAAAVNRFVHEAHRLLAQRPLNKEREAEGLLPANGILSRGAGHPAQLRNLVRHRGLNASVIAGERTVEGLGRLFGFRIVSRPGFSALPHTDLDGKFNAAMAELENRELVFLHIKGPDISAHDLDPAGKKACIERIDLMLAKLQRTDLVIGVTGDHSTDSNLGRHCGDPVPSLLVSPNGRRDTVTSYNESACMTGGAGRFSGVSFLVGMLDAMGAMSNYRPVERHFVFPT